MTKSFRLLAFFILGSTLISLNSCHITKGVDGVAGERGADGFSQTNKIRGDGNIVLQSRNIAEIFEKIEVSKGIQLILTQSEKSAVSVETDENLQAVITTTVENGTMIITSNAPFSTNEGVIVHASIPQINGLKSSSGASVKSTNTLKTKSLIVDSSSGSNVTIDVDTDFISLESSSGSTIKVGGKAIKVETESSSGSSILAGKLIANEVISQTSSGSTTIVNPVESLIAKASSGSEVKYYNVPKNLEKKESSGGSISKE